jgi:hypothetical protein
LKLSSNNNNNNTNNTFATYTRLQVIEGKKTTAAAECATLILARVVWKFIPDLPQAEINYQQSSCEFSICLTPASFETYCQTNQSGLINILKLSVKSPSLSPPIPSPFSCMRKVMKFY